MLATHERTAYQSYTMRYPKQQTTDPERRTYMDVISQGTAAQPKMKFVLCTWSTYLY